MTKAHLDKLDRVVIPKDICKALHLIPGSPVMFAIENGRVMITPEEIVCAVCGELLETENELRLCRKCVGMAKKLFDRQEVC